MNIRYISIVAFLFLVASHLLNCESPTKPKRDAPLDVEGENYQVPGTPIVIDPGHYVGFGENYTVEWNKVERANSYNVEESSDSLFVAAIADTVNETSITFQHYVNFPTSYYYRVRGINSDYKGYWSNTVDITINPPVPTTPTLKSPITHWNNVIVNWYAVSYATSYIIEESDNVNFSNSIIHDAGDSTYYMFFYNVEKTTTIYYRLKALGTSGSSDWSNTVECSINPFELVLNVSEIEVLSEEIFTISWNDVDANSYIIEEATNDTFTDAESFELTETSKIFSHTVKEYTRYYYRVKAINKAGYSDWSNIVDILINPIPPESPQLYDPGEGATSGEKYSISWRSVNNATTYTIQEATDRSFGGASSYNITGTTKDFNHNVIAETTYYYRIKANNLSGSSNWSNVVDIIVKSSEDYESVLNGIWQVTKGSSKSYGTYVRANESWTISNANYNGTIVTASISWFSLDEKGNITGTLEFYPTTKNLLLDVFKGYYSYDQVYTNVLLDGSTMTFTDGSDSYSLSKLQKVNYDASVLNGIWQVTKGSSKSYGTYVRANESWTISNANYNGTIVTANISWFSLDEKGNITGTLEFYPTTKNLLLDVFKGYYSYDQVYTNVSLDGSTMTFTDGSDSYELQKK